VHDTVPFGVSLPDQPTLYAVDLGGCQHLPRLAPESVASAFADVLRAAGATIVQTLTHNFPHTGLTCVLVLAESHAILHTWPETGTVNIDIFSCSTRLKSLAAIEALGRTLGATEVNVQEIVRADGHVHHSARRA
jgi:S-adenosylmethionine decarboxylase